MHRVGSLRKDWCRKSNYTISDRNRNLLSSWAYYTNLKLSLRSKTEETGYIFAFTKKRSNRRASTSSSTWRSITTCCLLQVDLAKQLLCLVTMLKLQLHFMASPSKHPCGHLNKIQTLCKQAFTTVAVSHCHVITICVLHSWFLTRQSMKKLAVKLQVVMSCLRTA